MKEFVIAFPLSIPKDSIWSWMKDQSWIATPPVDGCIYLKGISAPFQVFIQDAHPELVSIFLEHRTVSPEECAILAGHKSVLFFVGILKDKAVFRNVQQATQMFLEGGALGVIYEHCGAAHTAKAWLEECLGDSMTGWMNWLYIKNDLQTLGLDAFHLPDLITQAKDSTTADDLYALLLDVAENWFFADAPIESGHYVADDSGAEYLVRKELKPSFPKKHPHYNPEGVIRLVKTTKSPQ